MSQPTYEEFLERYCDGLQPLPWQRKVIEAVLAGRVFTITLGRQSGRTTVANWLDRYYKDMPTNS